MRAFIVSLTGLPLLIELVQQWFYQRDVPYIEGDCLLHMPTSWGPVLRWNDNRWNLADPQLGRYFFLRLPSWSWEPDYTVDFDRLVFMQRALTYFCGKWSVRMVPA